MEADGLHRISHFLRSHGFNVVHAMWVRACRKGEFPLIYIEIAPKELQQGIDRLRAVLAAAGVHLQPPISEDAKTLQSKYEPPSDVAAISLANVSDEDIKSLRLVDA